MDSWQENNGTITANTKHGNVNAMSKVLDQQNLANKVTQRYQFLIGDWAYNSYLLDSAFRLQN